jgi:hypothetical protein
VPLHLYANIYASGPVPKEWSPVKGGAIKYPVRNRVLRHYLGGLLAGKWKKVIKIGTVGEVHYFEHSSGQVAGVKFFSDKV